MNLSTDKKWPRTQKRLKAKFRYCIHSGSTACVICLPFFRVKAPYRALN